MKRSFSFVSCVLLAACGSATPAPTGAPPPEASTAAEAPQVQAPGGDAAANDDAQTAAEAPKEEAKKDEGPPTKEAQKNLISKDKATPQSAVVDEKPLGGQLTQNDIKAVVEKNGELFNDCYSMGAGKGEQFVAKVTLKVTLGPTGKVNQALVTSSNTKNPKVDQCVIDGFKKIQFPKPKDGGTTVFSFPMQFGGAVQVQ